MEEVKMNTRNKGILAILVFLLSTLVLLTVHHRAVADTEIEEKVYSIATLENEFADDKVLIVLRKDATFKPYSLEDFPEGLFSRVDDSTGLILELIKKQLEAEETGDWNELKHHVENNMLVDVENFRRILTLTLKEKSKENVVHGHEKQARNGHKE
jgi:hypothetical protein